jgi:hypothetical protein
MFNNQNESLTGNACYNNAGLIKGTTTTISTVNAGGLNLEINGLMYGPIAAAANFAPTACAVQAANSSAIYLVLMGTTGTVTVIKGGEAIIGSGSALNWPVVPANVAVIGGFKVVNANASSTFTMGTTALDATSVTYVAYNYCVAPTLLQVA